MERNKPSTSFGLPPEWDETVDVVVVGSGFAGLAAALEAARAGASVVILEKMSYFGGNSVISGGGYCCWDSKLHLREQLHLGEDSWQLHRDDTLKSGGGYSDPALVEVLAREAPDGLDFLVDLGVPFSRVLPRLGGHSAYRSYHTVGSTGRDMARILRDAALAAGARLELNAAVEGIWREGPGTPVSGVQVRLGERRVQLRAGRALVLASGGYSRDVALRTRYCPTLVDAYQCTNHRGATGEVLTFARWVGADVMGLEFIQLFPCANPQNGGIDCYALACYGGPGFGMIYVDGAGRRFVNELAGRDVVSDAQIRGGGEPTWSIFNRTVLEHLALSEEELERGVRTGRVLCAPDLEQLAAAAGLPSGQLRHTVEEHNAALAAGRDEQFGKPVTPQMHPLEQGPFYAVAQWPSIHYCMGGLRIDPDTRVLDLWGEPIPGLYAAGEVCGGIHGVNRLGGNALAECIVFGRRAGRAAAGYPAADK